MYTEVGVEEESHDSRCTAGSEGEEREMRDIAGTTQGEGGEE